MLFDSISDMIKFGFIGFEEIQTLLDNKCSNVPKEKGIYFVLKYDEPPEFLFNSVGGHYKGNDPTVPIEVLKKRWNDSASVIYIGQAGGKDSKQNLSDRLKKYMRFGQGKKTSHWGGRLIWQLKNNRRLKVCWKSILEQDPETIEKELIKEFEHYFGKKPFANLRT